MAETVSFKVFLTTEDNSSQQEIRRFGIEADAINFLNLRRKLLNIFPSIKSKRFTINWKDEDGDNIIISNDEELEIVLNETASEHVRKIYVLLKSDHGTPIDFDTNKSTEGLHVGVTCDGCEQPVRGFRFKCVQCPDYDLCSNCQNQGIHAEHCMLRLVSPVQWKPHYGKRLAHHMNKFVKKSTLNKEDEPKCDWHKKNFKHHHGRPRQCPVTESGWIDAISSYLNEFANLPGECPMKGSATTSEKPQNGATAEQTKSEEMKGPQNKKIDAHIELLKMVGQNLFQFLDPLGIDVNFQVNSNGTNPAPTPSTKNDNDKTKDPSVATPSTSNSTAENKINDERKEIITPSSSDNESSSLEKPGENEDWTIIGTNSENQATSGAIPKKPIVSTPEESQNSERPKGIYPGLPQSENTFYHPNKKIQKAVETLVQMGFTNEGGWLTNLLESKDGDIVSALDVLQPHQS